MGRKTDIEYLDDDHVKILDFIASKEAAHFNLIKRELKKPAKTLAKKITELRDLRLVTFSVGKQKKHIYRLTKKGANFLVKHRIRIRWGLSGLKWTEELLDKGYFVRFLSDFTGLSQHGNIIIAWHPLTKDVRLAEIFGVAEYAQEGNPDYIGQYVNRQIDPDKPIKESTLKQFIIENVEDLSDEKQVKKAIERFYREHNVFFAVLLPQEINFGFPAEKQRELQEIGRFGSLMFVGFKGYGQIPMVPKITICAGGFDLSENLRIKLSYYLNLLALYTVGWLVAKKTADPEGFDKQKLDEFLNKAWQSSLSHKVVLLCKNSVKSERGVKCRKTGKPCVALKGTKLDFKKCPIILEDVKQVYRVTQSSSYEVSS